MASDWVFLTLFNGPCRVTTSEVICKGKLITEIRHNKGLYFHSQESFASYSETECS